MTKKLLSAAIALTLVGCGGSGSGSGTQAPTYTVAGAITSTAVAQNALVCADLNQNLVCDQGEPAADAASGEFSITSEDKAVLSSNLIAQFDHQGQIATVMAPSRKLESGNEINGISSLLLGLTNKGMTLEEAASLLTAEINRSGVTAPQSLLDNTDDAALTTLDANVVAVLKQLTADNREAVLSALALSLSDHTVLTQANPAAAELTALIAPLSKVTYASRPLNDTGMTQFFTDGDDNASVTQPDYPGQDADHGLDVSDKKDGSGKGFDFVKLDDKGNTLADSATEWRCVQDKRTGLVWENKSDDATSIQYKHRIFALEIPGVLTAYSDDVDAAKGQTETGAVISDTIYTTKDYIDHINGLSLCGISDWRLPTGLEIYNLIDFGETAKDEDGNLLGLTHKYFPHQGKGSPDLDGNGEVWTDSLNYNDNSQWNSTGAVQYNPYFTRGDYRGDIDYGYEIYSDKSEADLGSSYQFPVRLVATKEASQ